MADPMGTDEVHDTKMPQTTADAIRRYLQVRNEIMRLEEEKDRLRDIIAKELEGETPSRWNAVLDGKPLVVTHGFRTAVSYDEDTLRQRLGEAFYDLLDIDGAKLRKNREAARPLLAPILATVGSVSPERVEAAIKDGKVKAEAFRGAFRKTVTPYVSIRSAQ